MKQLSLDELALRMAKTSASQRKRLARFAAQFCEQREAKPESLADALSPFLRQGIKTQKVPPVEMSVEVRLVPGLAVRLVQPELADRFPELSSKDLQQLSDIEPKLLEWLAESDERAARFVADPIGTLSESDLKIDPGLLDRLQKVRQRYSKEMPPSSLQIRSLRVTAVPK
jgi:hypothetical protein